MNAAVGNGGTQANARQRFADEIESIIGEAKANGETLRTGYHAGLLAVAYPDANFSIGRIIEELILAAAKASIPVEIGRA